MPEKAGAGGDYIVFGQVEMISGIIAGRIASEVLVKDLRFIVMDGGVQCQELIEPVLIDEGFNTDISHKYSLEIEDTISPERSGIKNT
jgi:hypothetical protein